MDGGLIVDNFAGGGGDVDGSACLSFAITTPVADIVVTLDGDETRRLRAQIDEVLR